MNLFSENSPNFSFPFSNLIFLLISLSNKEKSEIYFGKNPDLIPPTFLYCMHTSQNPIEGKNNLHLQKICHKQNSLFSSVCRF